MPRWWTALTIGQRCGAVLLVLLLVCAWSEGAFHGRDPAAQDLFNALSAPGGEELLGTDQYGRSMLARLGAATRLSFTLALLTVATSAVLGVSLGVLAAWHRGIADRVLSYLVNLLLALPSLVLVLLVAALRPNSPVALYLAISLVLWIEYFRVVRAGATIAMRAPQLEASRMLGFGGWYCFRRHIWPSLRSPVLTLAGFGAANAVIAMASLGFVSVGLKPPRAELGLMMVDLFPYYDEAPWALIQPLLVLSLLVLAFQLLARPRRS